MIDPNPQPNRGDSLNPLLGEWTRRERWRLPSWRQSARLVWAFVEARITRPVDDVDYRDRISVATWMVVLGLGLSLVVQLPTAQVSLLAFGSPMAIPFTGTMLAALFLAVVAGVGAESVLSVHPSVVARTVRRMIWPFWSLPMALSMIAAVLLPLAPSAFFQVLGLLLCGLLLAAAYTGLYATMEPGKPGFRRARLWLDAMAYGSALILFLFVYQTRTRSLLSGTLVALTALLLAVEILRTATDRTGTAVTYGGIIGMILGQVTWALNYWVLPGLTGGLLLLLIFYLMVGIAQQGLQERLTRRVLLEFVIFSVVALLLIALVGPGFQFAPSP